MQRERKGLGWWGLIWLTALQGALAFSVFPSVRELIGPEPLYNYDYGELLYQQRMGAEFFHASGRLHGYEPYFMAGWPLTYIWNSSVIVQTAGLLAPFLPMAVTLKLLFFLSALMLPVMVYWAIKSLDLGHCSALAGSVLAVIYFRAGIGYMFYWFGMTTALMVSYASVTAVALGVRYLRRGGAPTLFALMAVGPLALLMHKTAAVIVAPPALAALIIWRKSLTGARLALIGLALVVAVGANWFWIRPTMEHIETKVMLERSPYWQNWELDKPIKDYFSFDQTVNQKTLARLPGTTLTRLALMVLGVLGIAAMARDGHGPLARLLALTVGLQFLLTYYGSHLGFLQPVNPYRYLVPMNFFLCIPAGYFAAERVFGVGTFKSPQLTMGAVALTAGLGAVLLFAPNYSRLTQAFPLKFRLDNPSRHAARTLGDLSTPGSRLLIEQSGFWDPPHLGDGDQFNGIYLPALLPHKIDREIVGGPHPDVFLAHNWTTFHGGRLMERPVEAVGSDLRMLLTRYNIGWVLCWSRSSVDLFNRYPSFVTKIETFTYARRTFHLFRVDLEPGRFLAAGSGMVTARPQRIILDRLQPGPDGRVVLRYHWTRDLASRPPVLMEPVTVGDDPVPFIAVKDPPPRLVIFMER